MKIQLALDRLTEKECLEILEKTHNMIDCIEIGTGTIKEYGMEIIRNIKKRYPEKCILADMKICDAGKHEAKQAFDAGADIVTVMGFVSDKTIQETLKVAELVGKSVMVDLLEIHHRERVKEIHELGVKLVSLHVGKDQQSTETFNVKLFDLTRGFGFDVAVAGGIRIENVKEIKEYAPETLIVGSSITKSSYPEEAALAFRKEIEK